MTAAQSQHVPTSALLQTAMTIAQRFEHQGQVITPAEAVDRAIAARQQLAQLEALRDLDWADTVPCPLAAVAVARAGGVEGL